MNQYLVRKDGNMWCATFSNFINLQESIAGFGDTIEAAKIELLEKAYAELRSSATSPNTGNSGSCGDCECNEAIADSIEIRWPTLEIGKK